MNSVIVKQITAYFSTKGTVVNAVQYVQLVASLTWSEMTHLFDGIIPSPRSGS